MVTIGVICAMDSEFDLIREALSHGEIQTAGRCEFLSAERAGKRVVAATCGVGKVNAAVCAQMLISRFGADYVINSGVAGALSDRLRILDLVAARTVFYHDLEERLLQKYFPHCSRFPADERLVSLVEELAAGQGVRCVPGEIVSGEQFVTESAVKERIARETRADAIEMEGAAVGHACYLSGVPFAVVRCISDGADDSGGMDYDTFVGHAARRCAKITLGLIDRI